MKLSEAMKAVGDESDAESTIIRHDPTTRSRVEQVIRYEYEELLKSGEIESICKSLGMTGAVDASPVLLLIRLGMRVQRKLDHPDDASSVFDGPGAVVLMNNPGSSGGG